MSNLDYQSSHNTHVDLVPTWAPIGQGHFWFNLEKHVTLPHFRDINILVNVSYKVLLWLFTYTSLKSNIFGVSYSPNVESLFVSSCLFCFQQNIWGIMNGVSTESPNKLTFMYATFIFIHLPFLVAFISFWNLFWVQHNNPSHHIEHQEIVLSWVLRFELPSPMWDMSHKFMHEKSYFLN